MIRDIKNIAAYLWSLVESVHAGLQHWITKSLNKHSCFSYWCICNCFLINGFETPQITPSLLIQSIYHQQMNLVIV